MHVSCLVELPAPYIVNVSKSILSESENGVHKVKIYIKVSYNNPMYVKYIA